jgi:hypothetical protein
MYIKIETWANRYKYMTTQFPALLQALEKQVAGINYFYGSNPPLLSEMMWSKT